MNISDIMSDIPKCDLWQYLAHTDKPIVMYGMGNGADKIISVLDSVGAKISDFFASDGFVRGQSFHGKRVMSFSEIKQKYDDFIILVSFGSEREEVIENILRLDREHELYLPDVPVAGEGVFDLDFFKANGDAIEHALELLCDERSRRVLADVVSYKLTGRLEPLLNSTNTDEEVYSELFDTASWHHAVDLGAYNGDSASFIASVAPGLTHITAFEPDRKNYAKLIKNTEALGVEVTAFNKCAWSEETTLFFDRGGNRNSSVSGIGHTASIGDTKRLAVDAGTLDAAVGDEHVDFIKYDVEGSELEALKGSRMTLLRSSPDVLLSAYHRNEDIFALVSALHEYLPTHKLYMRRKRCLPAWEISICAVAEHLRHRL